MKLALVHYQYARGGGMDAHFVDLVRGFSDQGHEVDVWVYEASKELEIPKNVKIKQVQFVCRWSALKKFKFHRQIVQDLDPSRYDAVIGTMRTAKLDININGGTHPAYARNLYGKYKITDLWPIYFEWQVMKQSKKIVAHSEFIKKDLLKDYHLPADKVSVLYPPVNHLRYHAELRQNRKDYQLKFQVSAGKFTVFFPSTNHYMKGLDILLEAFSKLPEKSFELLIAGAPLPSDAPFAQNVRYLGYQKQIEELYVASDLTVLPSRYDGFGLTLTESLACGTPVLASRTTGASELIDSKHGIVLETLDPQAWANALIQAQSTPFEVDPKFLKNRGLHLDLHIQKLSELIHSIRGSR